MSKFIAISHLIFGVCLALFIGDAILDEQNQNKWFSVSILIVSLAINSALVFGHARARNWARLCSIACIAIGAVFILAILIALIVSWGFDYQIFSQIVATIGVSVVLILFFRQPYIMSLYGNE